MQTRKTGLPPGTRTSFDYDYVVLAAACLRRKNFKISYVGHVAKRERSNKQRQLTPDDAKALAAEDIDSVLWLYQRYTTMLHSAPHFSWSSVKIPRQIRRTFSFSCQVDVEYLLLRLSHGRTIVLLTITRVFILMTFSSF